MISRLILKAPLSLRIHLGAILGPHNSAEVHIVAADKYDCNNQDCWLIPTAQSGTVRPPKLLKTVAFIVGKKNPVVQKNFIRFSIEIKL